MRYIAGSIYIGGEIGWQFLPNMGSIDNDPGVQITFTFYRHISQYQVEKDLIGFFHQNGIDWIRKDRRGWNISCDELKNNFPDLKVYDWLSGTISPVVTWEHITKDAFGRDTNNTYLKFILTEEIRDDQMPKRIFLSHKGVDKPTVRIFKSALEAVGTEPWLDEDAMRAGTELERGLLQGFEDSCAAVFFITPEFQDKDYLATEINYAIAQKRKKQERFSIITIVFSNDAGQSGVVPALLEPYVYKKPNNHLDAFREIVHALPIRIGELGWR